MTDGGGLRSLNPPCSRSAGHPQLLHRPRGPAGKTRPHEDTRDRSRDLCRWIGEGSGRCHAGITLIDRPCTEHHRWGRPPHSTVVLVATWAATPVRFGSPMRTDCAATDRKGPDRWGSVLSPYAFGDQPGSTHQVILGRIRDGATVLDVGCNRGYLGRELHQRGCRIWGIDRDTHALGDIDPGIYVEVSAQDLDTVTGLPWPGRRFETIIAADVLEHLRDPLPVLSLLAGALATDGRILVSLPNIAHLSVRGNLLRGQFEYQDSGILDRTHLHFYTFATATRFVESAGLRITAVLSGSNRFGTVLNSAPRLGRVLRPLLAYNIIIEAARSDSR